MQSVGRMSTKALLHPTIAYIVSYFGGGRLPLAIDKIFIINSMTFFSSVHWVQWMSNQKVLHFIFIYFINILILCWWMVIQLPSTIYYVRASILKQRSSILAWTMVPLSDEDLMLVWRHGKKTPPLPQIKKCN